MMMVVYLSVEGGRYTSSVSYYDFGEPEGTGVNHQAAGKSYENTVLASGFFLNNSVSAVVGDNCITIFKGKGKPDASAPDASVQISRIYGGIWRKIEKNCVFPKKEEKNKLRFSSKKGDNFRKEAGQNASKMRMAGQLCGKMRTLHFRLFGYNI